MSELKPCPFCGSEDVRVIGSACISCDCCHASVEAGILVKRTALELLWNSIPRNTRTDGWISVKDRVPKMGEPVLVSGSHEHPWIGYRVADAKYDFNWVDICDNDFIVGITHWQPLPSAPESEDA